MELAMNDDDLPGDPHFPAMIEGAKNALESVLELGSGDNLLIVMDDSKIDIGQAFMEGARKVGAGKVDIYSLSKHARPLTDLPRDLGGMFRDYNVIVNTFDSQANETPFRVKLLYEEIAYNARVGHAPGITREMMFKGPMNVNYDEIVKNAERLMNTFENAKSVHITTKLGTDLILGIEDRSFQTDVKIPCGSFGNLPAGEIWCAPQENIGDGKVVVDGSIGDIGNVSDLLTLTLEGGKLVKIESDDTDLVTEIRKLTAIDDMSDVIGELGIGLNPNARLVGNLLEDEKAGKTAHIAFGNNLDMTNGCNNSKTHRDFLFKEPTMEITYTDGTRKTILMDGNVII